MTALELTLRCRAAHCQSSLFFENYTGAEGKNIFPSTRLRREPWNFSLADLECWRVTKKGLTYAQLENSRELASSLTNLTLFID
jgi:hypothetical protein